MADLAQGLTLRVGVWERDLDQGLRNHLNVLILEMKQLRSKSLSISHSD